MQQKMIYLGKDSTTEPHRVIRSDGKIGGYFGKTDGDMIERKRKLLESEQ